jgi:hypothetical protein
MKFIANETGDIYLNIDYIARVFIKKTNPCNFQVVVEHNDNAFDIIIKDHFKTKDDAKKYIQNFISSINEKK